MTRLRSERFGHCAGIALTVAYVLWLGWHALFAAPNLAFHKHVTTSGVVAGHAERLVDGERDPLDLDIGVDANPEAWVDVDLGGTFAIERVVVTNRTDCSFDASLPLLLEVSLDGSAYTLVEQRRMHFTTWTIPMKGMRANHVRVRSKARAQLGLNELEVFGRYAP